MDILKTPHQKLLEESGAMPYTEGYLKTPKQMMFEEAGALPKLAEGGEIFNKNPADMRAEIMAQDLVQPQEQPEIKLENQELFNTLKEILNNPGQLPKSKFDQKTAQLIENLFGPNIFAVAEITE
jgi:hypothetical protein